MSCNRDDCDCECNCSCDCECKKTSSSQGFDEPGEEFFGDLALMFQNMVKGVQRQDFKNEAPRIANQMRLRKDGLPEEVIDRAFEMSSEFTGMFELIKLWHEAETSEEKDKVESDIADLVKDATGVSSKESDRDDDLESTMENFMEKCDHAEWQCPQCEASMEEVDLESGCSSCDWGSDSHEVQEPDHADVPSGKISLEGGGRFSADDIVVEGNRQYRRFFQDHKSYDIEVHRDGAGVRDNSKAAEALSDIDDVPFKPAYRRLDHGGTLLTGLSEEQAEKAAIDMARYGVDVKVIAYSQQ